MSGQAQKYALRVQTPATDSAALNSLELETNFENYYDCQAYLKKLPLLLQSKGFVTHSIDSIRYDSTAAYLQLYLGQQYKWAGLRIDSSYQQLLQDLGWSKKQYEGKALQFGQLLQLQENLLNHFDNTGHPFASVQLDSVVINGEQVTAKLKIDKGFYYKFDSLHVLGDVRINKNFLYRYLDLPPTSPYSKQKLEQINQRLSNLQFLQQAEPWNLTMLNTGATVNLFLQGKKANQVNALVGFLPNNSLTTNNKLLVTGEANLRLMNALSMGETIGLNWQQLQPSSPRLNILYQHPFIFNTAFGIDFNFNLYKKDSSFLNIDATLGLQYVFSNQQAGKIIFSTQSTALQSEGIDTLAIKISKRLPETIDVSSWNIGVDYEFNSTNYRFNPRRGAALQVTATVGQKEIKRNSSITGIKPLVGENFNYGNLYDSFASNAYQFRVKVNAAHYLPIGRQTVLKTAIHSGWYQSPSFFRNELFQIGGYKLLRGFDEESIFTNRYLVATAEYRFLFGLNNYFSVFSDLGFTRYETALTLRDNSYWSVGIGILLETKAGIFNIAYAAGQRNDLPFDLRQSKIHIGFVTLF
jgi:outer membrane protein assembly factor BamA